MEMSMYLGVSIKNLPSVWSLVVARGFNISSKRRQIGQKLRCWWNGTSALSPLRHTGKESACNAGDPGSIPGWGRSPGEGNGYPLQYSFLENSMDKGAWWATVHGVGRSMWDWAQYTKSASKRFHRSSLLWGSGRNLYMLQQCWTLKTQWMK